MNRLSGDEHVMAPNQETDHRDGKTGEGNDAVAEYPLARETGEKVVINSLITPMAGRIMIYTAGCE